MARYTQQELEQTAKYALAEVKQKHRGKGKRVSIRDWSINTNDLGEMYHETVIRVIDTEHPENKIPDVFFNTAI